MIQKLIHWMRVVLPRFETALIIACLFTFLEFLPLFLYWQKSKLDYGNVGVSHLGIYAVLALCYGGYRAVVFHPSVNTDYDRWLASTPWTVRHPLPAGPIQIVPQDFVVLLIIWGLNHEFSIRSLYIPVAFLTGYQLVLAFIHWSRDEWILAYAVGFGLGAQCFFFRRPELQLLIAVACYPLTWLALRRTLLCYPWKSSKKMEAMKLWLTFKPTEQSLGWPIDALAPKPPLPWISRHDGICLACLIGWWHLAILWGVDRELRIVILMVTWFPLFMVPFIRVAAYMVGYRSPIDVLGRICTGRLIIPRYDCIWIACLMAWLLSMPLFSLAMMAGILTSGPFGGIPVEPHWFEAWKVNLGPLATTITFLTTFLMGPGLENWRLTGQHRISPTKLGKEFIEI